MSNINFGAEADKLCQSPNGKTEIGVSIIIPAYNEEKAIGQVLDQLARIMDETQYKYEIIVVDDGSKDATEMMARQYSGIKVLRHETNLGYGAALKTGITQAEYGIICITDADGTYPNEVIPQLILLFIENGFAMVVGSRTGEKVKIPVIRRPAKWVIGKLANYVAEKHIPDINSGLRVFRRNVARSLFDILPNGFSFTTTITLSMLTNGFRVHYVPINYHTRIGRSKIRPIHDTINFVELVLRIALYFSPLKVFVPFGVALFALAICWGLFTEFILGNFADVSTLVIVMSGVQVSVVGMLAELINRRLRLPNMWNGEDNR